MKKRKGYRVIQVRAEELRKGDVFRFPGDDRWYPITRRSVDDHGRVSIGYCSTPDFETPPYSFPGGGGLSWQPPPFQLIEIQERVR